MGRGSFKSIRAHFSKSIIYVRLAYAVQSAVYGSLTLALQNGPLDMAGRFPIPIGLIIKTLRQSAHLPRLLGCKNTHV